MAWADGTITLTVNDWGPYINADNDFSDYQQVLTLTASTNSSTGKLSWTLTASNNYSGGVATCIYLSIGGTVIYNTYWSYANRGDRAWNTYPTGDGSASGTIDIGTSSTSTASFAISLKLCCAQDARGDTSRFKTTSGTLTRTWWTSIGTGTVSIADNYNNSYTVSGTRGAAGTSNAVNGALLYWTHTKKTDGSWSYSKASNSESFGSGKTTHSKTISFSPSTDATRQVAGAVVTDGARNDTDSGWITANIKQYVCPSSPGDPEISYTKSRLTIKEPWTFTWAAATRANSSSPVKGYRIRIYRKRGTGAWTTIDFHDAAGNKLTSGSSDKTYDQDGGSTNSFTLSNPARYFLPGDQVQVKINSYTKYGNTNTGDRLYNNTQGVSPIWTVQNAGVMRVKPTRTSGWKEGVVWVKVRKNNIVQWVEADIVQVKVNTSSTSTKKLEWKESN